MPDWQSWGCEFLSWSKKQIHKSTPTTATTKVSLPTHKKETISISSSILHDNPRASFLWGAYNYVYIFNHCFCLLSYNCFLSKNSVSWLCVSNSKEVLMTSCYWISAHVAQQRTGSRRGALFTCSSEGSSALRKGRRANTFIIWCHSWEICPGSYMCNKATYHLYCSIGVFPI